MASHSNTVAENVEKVVRADNVLRVVDTHMRKMSEANPDITNLTLEAQHATASEKNMSFKQAFKLYKKAMLFSILFSTAIVMEGYGMSFARKAQEIKSC
jgi:SP family general alpha glucoside:H+ symporter-like MFS transporter